MLTRDEFEHLQQTLRVESGFVFTPPPLQIPLQVPIHHPPPMMYPPPVAPSQHLPASGSFTLSHQATMMPPPLHEQSFPGPRILLPPHEVFHNPQFAAPPQVPVAQPLPPPGMVLQVPAARPPLVIPPGNPPPPGMRVLLPNSVHFQPQ